MKDIITHYENLIKQKDEVIERQSKLLESYDKTVMAAIDEVKTTMITMRQYINLDVRHKDTWITGKKAASLLGINTKTLTTNRELWNNLGRLKMDKANPNRIKYSRLDCINFNKATL